MEENGESIDFVLTLKTGFLFKAMSTKSTVKILTTYFRTLRMFQGLWDNCKSVFFWWGYLYNQKEDYHSNFPWQWSQMVRIPKSSPEAVPDSESENKYIILEYLSNV